MQIVSPTSPIHPMSDTQLLKDHALAVRAVRFKDQVALNSAIQRSKMLIRQVVPKETHCIEEIDQIGFAPSVWPCEQAYELRRWTEGCEELASLLETVASQLDTFGVAVESEVNRTLTQVCERFHQVALQLRSRHKGRPTLEITDEYDVQDLLHAVLRIFFDDVRPEEWVPSLRWVPFTGQFQPLTSLTQDGRNRVRSECRPLGEFCLSGSCAVLHGSTSTESGPG